MYKISFLVVLFGFLEVQGGAIKATKIATVNAVPSESNGFQVKISTGDKDYHLNLKKPENAILSPDFKFLVMDVNEDGVTEIHDRTPTPEELFKTEEHLYLTSGSASSPQALVKIQKDEDSGFYRVNGYIDGHEINHHSEDKHILTLTEPISREVSSAPTSRTNDYIDLGRNITESEALMTRQAITAQPEVAILFDYANFQTFSGNTNNINYYLSVFYRAINNRYATITDPKITATVTGVFAFNSRAAQPFMEESKIPDGSAYDMNTVLDKLSYWVQKNKASLPKHDVASLLSGEPFKAKDSNGNYVSGIAGLAYLGGACWTYSNTRYLGTSVNADAGGFWNGVMTASHELAHNLNSPHDGDSGASSCPWSGGYIMSYEGWGTKNKFYFSPCSISLMKTFVTSTQGACVKTYQSSTVWGAANEQPGDRLDMTAQCKKHLNRTDAVVETANRTPEDQCRNLKCRVPYGSNGYMIYTMNRIPGDNSPCGTNMVCKDGECIAKTTGK